MSPNVLDNVKNDEGIKERCYRVGELEGDKNYGPDE